MTETLLEVSGLEKEYPLHPGRIANLMSREASKAVHAVDGVDFSLARGEVLGLAGESGAGKSTIARLILRLIEPTGGEILFDGVDVRALDAKAMRRLRRRMQIVFQDPMASMNPRMTVGDSILYPTRLHMPEKSLDERRDLALRALADVGLDPPSFYYEKYPHQLSGGQRQRAVIARAVVTAPDLVVLDEPIAMADVSVRTLLLDLLNRLKEEHRLTYLYITHDLATARYICDRIAILYLGKVVEIGPASEVLGDPQHPYTRSLVSAVPVPDPGRRRLQPLPHGEIPDAINPPPGCRFHPRCAVAIEGVCNVAVPELLQASGNIERLVACHLTSGEYPDHPTAEGPTGISSENQ